MDKSSCDIHAVDEVFGGNPCVNLTDSKIGRRGVDDPNVLGIDPYPQTDIPYFGDIKKRLYVLVRISLFSFLILCLYGICTNLI